MAIQLWQIKNLLFILKQDGARFWGEATRKLAKELAVDFIDLEELTENIINSLGDEPSKEYFLWTLPDDKYPEGRKDDTHLSVKGANMVAKLALDDVVRQKLSLAAYLLPSSE